MAEPIVTNIPDAPKGKRDKKTEVTPAKKTKGTEHAPSGLSGPTMVKSVAEPVAQTDWAVQPREGESPLRGVRNMRRNRQG